MLRQGEDVEAQALRSRGWSISAIARHPKTVIRRPFVPIWLVIGCRAGGPAAIRTRWPRS